MERNTRRGAPRTRLAWLALALGMCGGVASAADRPVPLEFPDIPVNGNPIVADPTAVSVHFGFESQAASLLVAHGDSLALLDAHDALATPHVNWARTYANGPVRVLYIASQSYTVRNPIELRQRSDFDITVLTIPNVLDDGEGSQQRMPALHAFFRRRMEETLAREYDAIVLPAPFFEKRAMSADPDYVDWLLETVAAKVKAGTGLLILQGDRWYRIPEARLALLHAMSPLAHGLGGVCAVPARTDVAHPLSESLSFRLWPPTALGKSAKTAAGASALATVDGTPFVAAGHYGKGRVVAVYLYTRDFAGITPEFDPERASRFGDYYEPVYAFYLQALAWAAGREPRVGLAVPDVTASAAGAAPRVDLTLARRAAGPERLAVRFRLQDPWGVEEGAGRLKVRVGAAPVTVQPDLPVCRVNGRHRLDLWVTAGDRVETWGCAAIDVTNGAAFAVEALPPADGGPIAGVARYRIRTGVAGELQVRATDDLRRIFCERTLPVQDGAVVEVDLARAVLPRNRVEFTLRIGGTAVARQCVDLYVPRIGRTSIGDEFIVATYDVPRGEAHLAPYFGVLLREIGFNAVYLNWHYRHYIRDRAADLGLWCLQGASWSARQMDIEKELKECPNKPEVQAKRHELIAQTVDDVRTYGGLSRTLDDETWFANTLYRDGEMRGQQACQCTNCLALFRAEMRRRYGDIAALNAAWDTDFKDFDAMRVIEEDEVRGKDNPAGWLEFRQYMNWTYAQYFKWVNAQHAALGADYGVGVGAPHWTSRDGGPTYRGGDYSFLKDTVPFMMAYGGPEARQFKRAFVGQPGAQKYDPPLEWTQRGPWYHLLNGADALWYYSGPEYVGTELAWRQHSLWIRDGVREIRDGVGVLVSRATPVDRQVRILYSSENLALGWLLGKRADAWNALRLSDGAATSDKTFRSLFDDFLCVQPSAVTADEIRAGDLRDCRLLVLPQALAMDDATAEAIRGYVARGGCVVADVMPATRQLYGKPRPQSALADVFGVDFSRAAIHQEDESWYAAGIGMRAGETALSSEQIWLPASLTFTGVTGTTARAQGRMLSRKGAANEADICFLNRHGQGQALLLNFGYRDLDLETAAWHRLFGEALARWAGLEAPAWIVDPASGAPLPYRPLRAFTRGPATLLGCIRGQFIWSGGRPVHTDPSRALAGGDRARFAWRGARHTYDVRQGRYLGRGEAAELDLPSYEGRLLALLPYKVNAVRVSAAGAAGEIAATVEADAAPGEHVLHMDVYSPTGLKHMLYSGTRTAPGGRTVFRIPFADNDRAGRWRIVVRDVMTGVAGETVIRR